MISAKMWHKASYLALLYNVGRVLQLTGDLPAVDRYRYNLTNYHGGGPTFSIDHVISYQLVHWLRRTCFSNCCWTSYKQLLCLVAFFHTAAMTWLQIIGLSFLPTWIQVITLWELKYQLCSNCRGHFFVMNILWEEDLFHFPPFLRLAFPKYCTQKRGIK